MTKHLSKLFLLAAMVLIYITNTSSINGIYNGGTSCGGGGCHGTSANTATTVTLGGLPTSFIAGQTYNLTFTVSNATQPKAGFNIYCTAGAFTNGTGSKVSSSKTQITHTAPMAAASGITTFSFTWKAPASITPVTFSSAGNAVNGNNSESGDQWNTATVTVPGAYPAAVSDIKINTLACFPNPTMNQLSIKGYEGQIQQVIVFNLQGQAINVPFNQNADASTIDCSQLTAGQYFISVKADGKSFQTRFVKQ